MEQSCLHWYGDIFAGIAFNNDEKKGTSEERNRFYKTSEGYLQAKNQTMSSKADCGNIDNKGNYVENRAKGNLIKFR